MVRPPNTATSTKVISAIFRLYDSVPGIDQHDSGGDNQRGGCGVDIVELVEGEEDYQR